MPDDALSALGAGARLAKHSGMTYGADKQLISARRWIRSPSTISSIRNARRGLS